MAEEVKKGVEKVSNVQATLYQVPETLPPDALQKMHAPPKSNEHPVIKAEDLKKADGIIFGVPTRFGSACAQMKAFMDTTGQLWLSGALSGKPAAIFFSTGLLGGGQETTALTFLTHFAHHGMIYVPLGSGSSAAVSSDEARGGSPYGAGTLAGSNGDRSPSALELAMAMYQGESFAKITKELRVGREVLNKK